MTAPLTLSWNVLRWNFDVDLILGHHVEYIGSMSRLPISVLVMLVKKRQLVGGACQAGQKFSIFGG